MIIHYQLNTPNLTEGLKTAIEIQAETGMTPVAIEEDSDNTFSYNKKDANMVVHGLITEQQYRDLHPIIM